METRVGRDKDILHKQGVETDFKYREESFKDAPTPSNNIKGSQQTPFLRKDEHKQKAKITVHTTEEAMTTNKERTPVSVWCGYENTLSFYIQGCPKSFVPLISCVITFDQNFILA